MSRRRHYGRQRGGPELWILVVFGILAMAGGYVAVNAVPIFTALATWR